MLTARYHEFAAWEPPLVYNYFGIALLDQLRHLGFGGYLYHADFPSEIAARIITLIARKAG